MRADQHLRLQNLEERLVDVFCDEAEPTEWPGAGMKIAAMDSQTRGDRYWVKKNAAASMVLIRHVGSLIGNAQGNLDSPTTPPGGADAESEGEMQLDHSIAAAEKEASKLMASLQAGGGSAKAEFDKRVHGKG